MRKFDRRSATAPLPLLSSAYAALAGLLLTLSRWAHAVGMSEPHNDTAFNLMLSIPAALFVGMILGIVANAHGFGPANLAALALFANGGLLLALAVFAIATY